MILEIAQTCIPTSKQTAFFPVLRLAIQEVLSQSPGFIRCEIRTCIEHKEQIALLIYWQTLENHTQDFRESERFVEWRARLSPYFAQPPQVLHYECMD